MCVDLLGYRGNCLANPSQGGQYVNNWMKPIIVAVLVALLGSSLAACGTTRTTPQTGSSQQALGNVTFYMADGLEAYYKQVIRQSGNTASTNEKERAA